MKAALKYFALFIIFSILFIAPAIIFPIAMGEQKGGEADGLNILFLLLIDTAAIIYLVQRINLHGTKLFLSVITVFWGLQTFMTQIETWYFREAMPAITDNVLLKLFINPLITAALFIPIAMLLLGKWKSNISSTQIRVEKINWKSVIILSIAYVPIYFLFGHFVAWQFTAVREFYSGTSESLGFFSQFQHTLSTYDFIIPFQLLRGFLWTLAGLPVVLYLKGTRTEKIIACLFVYAVLTCVQLIVDNPFMPSEVRLGHLLEVSLSNGLFGLLVGLVATKK